MGEGDAFCFSVKSDELHPLKLAVFHAVRRLLLKFIAFFFLYFYLRAGDGGSNTDRTVVNVENVYIHSRFTSLLLRFWILT